MRTLPIAALVVALAAPVFTSSALRAAEEEPRRESRGTRAGDPAARPANLEHTMESMEKIFTALKAQVKDKTKAESSLKLVADMQRHVLIAKSIVPGSVNKLPAAEKEKAATNYRTMMLGILRELLSAEESLLQGKFDEADETIKGIEKMEDQGHKEFKVKKD